MQTIIVDAEQDEDKLLAMLSELKALGQSFSTATAFKHIVPTESMVEIVGEKLLALQEALFDMLVEITDFFDSEGITYTLGGGTCLGAVRHGGFIPWDDDIDLNIPRSSYERLRERFAEGLGSRYWLHTPEDTGGYGIGYARIRKKGTIVRSREDFETDECGACIDVFIVENAPDALPLRFAHGIGSLGLGFALSCRRFAHYRDRYLEMVDDDSDVARVFRTKAAIGKAVSFASVDFWCGAWNRWNSLYHNEHSKYVVVPVGRRHYFGEIYPRTVHYPVTLGTFEGKTVKLPADAPAYMRQLYGDDYMIPPPEGEHESHVVFEFDLGGGYE